MEQNQFELSATSLDILPLSLAFEGGVEYGLAKTNAGERLALLAGDTARSFEGFSGESTEIGGKNLLVCALTPQHAAALRGRVSWLWPRPIGLRTSVGMGDRLGLATPGHIRALRAVSGTIAPIFAQQSIREMTRTGRTPQQVMDDATWGIFAGHWTGGVGADADHLKTFDDIDLCLAAGYTLFTVDPGEYVYDRAESVGLGDLRAMAAGLPSDTQPRYSGLLGRTFDIENLSVTFDEATLLKAAVKYGRAIAHVAGMYRHLAPAAGMLHFELEVSVDETHQPTSHAEHIYIASELKRLEVTWISLAPRYVGLFEKGVDYIGDLKEFEADIAGHVAIARHFGPYKLSLHSGSDKFSIYAAAASQTRGLVHLKTAGTSYLEALRTIAVLDPDLLCEIYVFARERYQTDRASYHVSAELSRAPNPGLVHDWVMLLDQFDAREILHVTFGSVLTARNADGQSRFRDRLLALLRAYPDAYAANLERHFVRHLKPFVAEEGA
jgi:tagaturonate epimerase